MTSLAVLGAGGLALGLASPHLIVGLIPQGLAGAGHPITVWPGTGLDLAALALLAAALRGFVRASDQLSLWHSGWRQILFTAVVGAGVLGVVAGLMTAAWLGLGPVLTRQLPITPAVAADQAQGPMGNRLLAITRTPGSISYRLVGAEPGPVVRDLPAAAQGVQDPLLRAAVTSTVGTGEATSANTARDALADLGIGFVTFQGPPTSPLVTQLDTTAGLTRLSSNRGVTLWRVLPRENTTGSSRLRLVDAQGIPLATVAASGDHGRSDVRLGQVSTVASAGGRRLVVAEPKPWVQHARVTYAGRPLTAVAGTAQPTYLVPPTGGRLDITLEPTRPWWRWGQLGLLLVVLFLAAPVGARHAGRTP